MSRKFNRQRNQTRYKTSKFLLATTVGISSFAGLPMPGDVEKTEAAKIYTWEKYSNTVVPGQKKVELSNRRHTVTQSIDPTYEPSIRPYGGWKIPKSLGYGVDRDGLIVVNNDNTTNVVLDLGGRNPAPFSFTYFKYEIIGNIMEEYVTSTKPDGSVNRFTQSRFVNDVKIVTSPSTNKKGTLITTLQAGENDFVHGQRNADGYWYVRGAAINQAPSTPTLTVTTTQFEHGGQHIIGWNATDVDGDELTYTLQASYNGGAWENLYNGTAKSYTYTVPNNRGANVKFRVIASDGSLTSTSAESASKSIREVMYHWNKYKSEEQKAWTKKTSVPFNDTTTMGSITGDTGIGSIPFYDGFDENNTKNPLIKNITNSSSPNNLVVDIMRGLNTTVSWYYFYNLEFFDNPGNLENLNVYQIKKLQYINIICKEQGHISKADSYKVIFKLVLVPIYMMLEIATVFGTNVVNVF